mgnify:CR=1 FL=1
MKNAKKILLFLGAISLVAFGSFNMTGNKSNKNTVAESKETETDKKENKKLKIKNLLCRTDKRRESIRIRIETAGSGYTTC